MELKIEKKTFKRILLVALLCIVLYWALSAPKQISAVFGVLSGIFTPFIVGLVIAFIINVPMRWLGSQSYCNVPVFSSGGSNFGRCFVAADSGGGEDHF